MAGPYSLMLLRCRKPNSRTIQGLRPSTGERAAVSITSRSLMGQRRWGRLLSGPMEVRKTVVPPGGDLLKPHGPSKVRKTTVPAGGDQCALFRLSWGVVGRDRERVLLMSHNDDMSSGFGEALGRVFHMCKRLLGCVSICSKRFFY